MAGKSFLLSILHRILTSFSTVVLKSCTDFFICVAELLKDCKELWTFVQEISKGMEPELKMAQSLNIPILDKSNEFTDWEKEHFST